MRILVLNHFACPPNGVGGTRHAELFGNLDNGHQTLILASAGSNRSQRKPAHKMFRYCRTFPTKGGGLTRVLSWITYFFLSFFMAIPLKKINIIYASSPHLLAALSGLILSRIKRVPFILEIRDIWPRILFEMGTLPETSIIYRALIWLEVLLYRKADKIVAMAQGTVDHIVEVSGKDTKDIFYIPNGSDPSFFRVPESREELRAKLGFEGFTCVYTGAHGVANGLEEILEAAKYNPEVSFVFYGGGPRKKELINIAKKLGLTNTIFRDPVLKDKIPEILKAADVGIHCLAPVELFQHGVSPNKLFDYMAAGLPVITNTQGLVANIVSESESGWVCKPGELPSAIRDLIMKDEQDLRERGENGKQWIQKNQSRTLMRRRLTDLLKSVS